MNILNYLPKNRNDEEVGVSNWDFIEISHVDDKIIKKLLDKLVLGISEDFFISFESIIKIGKKAKSEILGFIRRNKLDSFIRELLFLIIQYIDEGNIDTPLIFRLYHPDFVIRAKTIMEIMEMEENSYFKFIMPLIEDPDDSVRYAVLKFLISQNSKNNPLVFSSLKAHLKKELNPIIKTKIEEFLAYNS